MDVTQLSSLSPRPSNPSDREMDTVWRVALGLLLLPRLSREFIANKARDGESERKMQGHNDPVPSGVASARAAQKGVRTARASRTRTASEVWRENRHPCQTNPRDAAQETRTRQPTSKLLRRSRFSIASSFYLGSTSTVYGARKLLPLSCRRGCRSSGPIKQIALVSVTDAGHVSCVVTDSWGAFLG